MAILYRASAARPWRRAALAAALLALGVALVWLLRPGTPAPEAVLPAVLRAAATVEVPMPAADGRCDARCAAAKVIVPASTACAAAIGELAGFGVRWLDAEPASPKFDRFTWLQSARDAVTLAGGRAEFRNAGGSYLPVEYACDFDPATLTVLEARARPMPSR